nr:UPF0193 protein EVG1 homolog isoform X2 [Procambarus clarkii]
MASVSRQNVASGGIYDLPRVSYSESTRLLLKELLQEAAVNLQHQRRIERWVSGGRSLPHHEALAGPSQPTQGQRRPSSSSSSSSFRQTPRPCIQTKRSHEAIKKMGLYEPNTHYVPPPPMVSEMEERVHWLEAMEALGEGGKFRHLIAAQLALKLRDLELIDQERARDLNRAMKLKIAAAPKQKLTNN